MYDRERDDWSRRQVTGQVSGQDRSSRLPDNSRPPEAGFVGNCHRPVTRRGEPVTLDRTLVINSALSGGCAQVPGDATGGDGQRLLRAGYGQLLASADVLERPNADHHDTSLRAM
jgi:hypothetical protein